MRSSPSRRIQPAPPRADASRVTRDPGPRPLPHRPRGAGGGPGGRPWGTALVAVPAAGVLASALAAVLAPAVVALLVALGCALALAGVLALALAAAHRAHREAERAAGSLLTALEAARDENVNDVVTGLLNRRGLMLVGHQVLESARRSGGAVHACVVEVTPGVRLGGRPETPEQTRGRREAEWAATAVALRAATRTSDVVARTEEGRFVVLGPGAGLHAQELERRVRVGLAQERLQAAVSTAGVPAPADDADRPARLSVEVGAAVLAPWDEGAVPELLVRAEQALAQRRALRRSTPQHGWGRRRADRGARPERPQA
jgi:GGDEF domain-containing protein